MSVTLPALLFVLHLFVFHGVGTLILRILRAPHRDSPAEATLMAWGASALTSYMVFWLYLADRMLGLATSIVLCSLGLLEGCVRARRWFSERDVVMRDTPFILAAGAGLAYLGIFYLVPMDLDEMVAVTTRFVGDFPLDNLLPVIFAERLWGGTDPRGFPNDWLSSDRPPLHAGILLVQRPIAILLGNESQSDLALGVVAQLCWIPALWAACSALGHSRRQRMIVMAFCLTTGFVFFNTIYTWPKMLAGGLAIGCVAQFLRARFESRELTRREWISAAVLAALALLSHPGIVFTLIAFATLLPLIREQLDLRGLATACLTGLVLLAPWTAYQKFYEPPANRLLKWHLAGSPGIDDRSFGETIVESYGSRSTAQIAELKASNVRALFGWSLGEGLIGARSVTLHHFFPSLGLLNLAWLVLLVKPRVVSPATRFAVLVSFASIAIWVILMFGPAGTSACQGSFATTLLACLTSGSVLAALDRRIAITLLSIHSLAFVIIWITPVAADGKSIGSSHSSLCAFIVMLAGVVVALWTLRKDVRLEASDGNP